MIIPLYYGKVVNKRIQWPGSEARRMAQHIEKLDGQEIEVVLRKRKSKRSEQQNKYLFGCVYPLIAEHTGEHANLVHKWCAEEFLPKDVIKIAGKEKIVTPSTTELSTKTMAEYIERIRLWANEELQITIPSSNEPYEYP